jgi:hypothetical protein
MHSTKAVAIIGFGPVGATLAALHMTPYRPTIYQGSDGEPIQHLDMGPSPYPLAWAPSYTFNQLALEASTPSTSPGSFSGCSRGAPPKACWTAMATSVGLRWRT